MSHNELWVVVAKRDGKPMDRRAFKDLTAAKKSLGVNFNKDHYRLERYLPAPIKEVKDHD